MKKFLVLTLMLLVPAFVFAQVAEIQPADFFAQVVAAVKQFGGLTWIAKVSSICILLVASMKVTFLNQLIWSKLGKYKSWVAPVLALIGGLLSQNTALTLAGALAYLGAGAGATYLSDILDLIKAIPGIGAMYVSLINIIESALGGPASEKK